MEWDFRNYLIHSNLFNPQVMDKEEETQRKSKWLLHTLPLEWHSLDCTGGCLTSLSNQKISSKSKLYHSILLLLNFHLLLTSIQRQASKYLSTRELTKSKWKCTAACKRGHMHAHIHKHTNYKKKNPRNQEI